MQLICTGGQKFGILSLILSSLKNKSKNKSKNLCLVKFEVLGYTNKQTLLRNKSTDQFKQVGVREKNDRNQINSCGGPPRLAIHLRGHLNITNGYPFWYCCSGFRFHFPG